jgi:predicted nicotinamide N-methyase
VIASPLVGDNRERRAVAFPTRTIAGFEAAAAWLGADADGLGFWTVADLERYVDREALLRSDDAPEPPYWATCWSGARVLAGRVPHDAGRVLEVGCGLGVPGAVAARRGAQVVFADRVAAPLAFVRETLRTNGLRAAGLVVADVLRAPWRGAFDVVLAAEVLYDRATFGAMAAALAAALAPGGRILLADGHRIDTAEFYAAAAAAGLVAMRDDVRVEEEGFPVTISVVEMWRR